MPIDSSFFDLSVIERVMRRHKAYTYVLLSLLFCYLIFNLVTWKLFTNRLLNDPDCPGGDLTRMAYISGSKTCRQNENNLPVKHIKRDQLNEQKIDVLTIGDSFSNGGGGGRNSYYQDYIASLNNFSVLNIPQYKKLDKISTISILNNNGYLDKIKPRFVLIEYSEKLCFTDFPDRIDFNKSISEKELEQYESVKYYQKTESADNRLVKLDFFSQANYKLVRNSILYHFSDNAFDGQVYKAKLDRDLFSAKNADVLLFFHADIKYRKRYTAENIAKLNGYLNVLGDRLATKGIKLYFMPCVDKYNLYSKYIIDNKYPEGTFFEELRKLPKRYDLIDTKKILLKELEKGVIDLYHADDTHWSWKAAEQIFTQVRFNR